MSGPVLGAIAFRMALRCFPADFRRGHETEMRDDYAWMWRRHREQGRVAAAVFTARAVWDAARQGWTERTRRGPLRGHGAPVGGPDGTNGNGRRGGMLEGILQDVRLGFRSARRTPGLTAAAVVVLALGIGANTTVFSALKMAILAPPPYPAPERLVVADLSATRDGQETQVMPYWSFPKLERFLEQPDRRVDPVAGYGHRSLTLTDAGDPVRIGTELVTPGYFQILGGTPILGRAFGPDELDADSPSLVTVLSWPLWQERFGGDPDVIGRTLTLNGTTFEVVGVAPRGFQGLTGYVRLWVPAATGGVLFSRFMVKGTQAHWMNVVGRLRAGATFEEAQAQMTAIGRTLDEAFPTDDTGEHYGAGLRRFTDVRANPQARAAVLLLSAAAALVLLVACANLSGLLLARAKTRARDGAVRLAVGASRWRLIRAAMVESGVLATLGGLAGILLALWGTQAMGAAWPDRFLSSVDGEMRAMNPDALGLDRTVVAFALAVSFVTAFLFGLAPALRATRGDLVSRLKEGTGATRRGRGLLGLDARGALLAAQVALALMLLVGAGLVGGSLKRLLAVDEGFDANDLLVFQYAIPRTDARYAQATAFHEEYLQRVASIGGVEGVTTGTPPYGGHWSITRVQDIPGKPPIPQGEGELIGVHEVGDAYFDVLGIPVLKGRALGSGDGNGTVTTLVINATAAEKLFPGEDPVGQRIKIGVSDGEKDPYARIVGVVGDVRYTPPDQDIIAEAYVSSREFHDPNATVMVRTSRDPMDLLPAMRETLKALDPQLAVFAVTTLADERAAATGDRRVVLALLGLFALVTVVLAATGTWGIVAYAVADRRRELGLRMALGSDTRRVVRMVVGRSLTTAAPGLAVGLLGAWATSRILEAFLYRTSPRDPATFLLGAAFLTGVVLVASWLPARRVSRVDPSESLRAE